MLKLMSKQAVTKLCDRIKADVRENDCYLMGGTANRYVHFGIRVSNPTPWELEIKDISCMISYDDIVIVRKALILDVIPIIIRKETASGTLVNIAYDPFSSPIGLPVNQNGWKIQGMLHFSSDFGSFNIPITETHLIQGKLAQNKVWNDSVAYVKQYICKVIS